MSDCEKCWDTPCTCGWDYRNYPKERREELAAAVLGIKTAELQAVFRAPEKHPKKDDPQWLISAS